MTQLQFVKVNNQAICEFIRKARNRLIYVKPAFYKQEIEELINTAKRNDLQICEIYMDESDEAIRFGFGEREAIDLILQAQNKVMIQLVDKIRLSFLIVDNNCLIFSPSIAQLEDIEETPTFPNGLYGEIDIVEMLLKQFPPYLLREATNNAGKVEQITNPFEGVDQIELSHQHGVSEHLTEISNNLEKNPPVSPNNLRMINFYRNNYKILKRKIFGVKVKTKKISLSSFKKMLPANNERLLNSWVIFTSSDLKEVQDITFFDKEVEVLDNQFLYDFGRFGSLVDSNRMNEYKKQLIALKNEFIEYLKNEIKDNNRFVKYSQEHRGNPFVQLLENSRLELINYLINSSINENKFLDVILTEDRSLDRKFNQGKIDKEEVYLRFISDFVDNKLKFPLEKDLIEQIDIKIDIYDISDELINDEEFNSYIQKYNLNNLRLYEEGFEKVN